MSDKIIRNPFRKLKVQSDFQNTSDYQTEYQRLNVEPVSSGRNNDFRSDLKTRTSPPLVSFPSPKSISNERVRVMGQNEVPEQVNISSGRNKVWHNPQEEEDSIKEFNYDEIPSPPPRTIRFENKNYHDELDEEIEFGLDNVEPGQYLLLLRGQLIFADFSLVEVEKAIETILFDEKSDIGAGDLKVFKSLPVRVGVLVDDR